MKILKRNQVIISVIALILMTVGYMSYTSNVVETTQNVAGIGDAKLVNSSNIVEDKDDDIEDDDDDESDDSSKENSAKQSTPENNGEESKAKEDDKQIDGISETANSTETMQIASSISTQAEKNSSVQTSSSGYQDEYFTTSKLERDRMYSQMLETYQGLLKNETTPTEEKNSSTQEITNINKQKNSVMIAENLIKNLGFEDVVIFVNNNSISVVVKAEKLQEADVAQIQNIVCREIGVEADKIHISVK